MSLIAFTSNYLIRYKLEVKKIVAILYFFKIKNLKWRISLFFKVKDKILETTVYLL